jgi:hypothetical protein
MWDDGDPRTLRRGLGQKEPTAGFVHPRSRPTAVETTAAWQTPAVAGSKRLNVLTPRQLAIHLVREGLFSDEALVDGDLTIEVMPGRNYNHRITRRRGPNLLVKQSRDSSGALAAEAAMYRVLQRRYGKDVAWYLPQLRLFDRRRRLLLLNLIVGSHTVAAHVAHHGRIGDHLADSLGRAVGALHRSGTRGKIRSTGIPWVLSLAHPPIELLREISSANLQMIRLLQESEAMCRGLDELAASWREYCWIHNDLRWENCLVSKSGRAGPGLKLIDWELAGTGDPDWDIGAVFSSFLAAWIFSMRFVTGLTPEALAKSARHPLARFRPAIGTFWRAYVTSRGMSATAARESSVRAMRFAAARLVQFAFERQQDSSFVTGNVVCLIQMCANVMVRPELACSELLGLNLSE